MGARGSAIRALFRGSGHLLSAFFLAMLWRTGSRRFPEVRE